MRFIVLIVIGIFISFSSLAQDLRYQDVLAAFSVKDLPKSKNVTTYQAIDGNVYSIGSELTIGSPRESGKKRFSYIETTSEHSGTVVVINSFVVMGVKSREMGSIGGCIGAVVVSNKKIFTITNFDMAIDSSEIIRGGSSSAVNVQSAQAINENGFNVQNVEQPVNQTAPNQSEVVANQQSASQSGVITFGAEAGVNNTGSQSGTMAFGAETSTNNFNNNLGLDGLNDVPTRKGYGGIVMADIGFDAYNIGLSAGVSIINGYHFNSNWYVGGGVGVLCYVGGADQLYYYESGYGNGYYYENYYYDDANSVCVPIFAYGKYTFTIPRKVWPYVALGLGVNISSYTSVYLNVSGGVAIKMKNEKQHLKVGLSFPMDFVNGVGMGVQVGYSF